MRPDKYLGEIHHGCIRVSMGAIVPIDFEKALIAPIDFRCKHEVKGNLHPSIVILDDWQEILHQSNEMPNDVPVLYG